MGARTAGVGLRGKGAGVGARLCGEPEVEPPAKLRISAGERKRLGQELIWAAEQGETRKVRRLLKEGADPDSKDRDEWTVLMFACWRGSVAMARSLIEAKADVNARSRDGGTALMQAFFSSDEDKVFRLVRMLIDAGADVNAKDNDGWSALKLARELKLKKTEAILKAAGAKE